MFCAVWYVTYQQGGLESRRGGRVSWVDWGISINASWSLCFGTHIQCSHEGHKVRGLVHKLGMFHMYSCLSSRMCHSEEASTTFRGPTANRAMMCSRNLAGISKKFSSNRLHVDDWYSASVVTHVVLTPNTYRSIFSTLDIQPNSTLLIILRFLTTR